jgi:hypothetical protein
VLTSAIRSLSTSVRSAGTSTKLLAAIAAVTIPTAAVSASGFEEGDFELRFDGFAQADVEFDSSDIAVTGSFGYFFADQFEGGVRQTLSYDDFGGSNVNGGTAVFVNYHFGGANEPLQPFIGGSLGYNYGDTVTDTFFAGPEGGVKYFIGDNDEWFIFGQVEYQFFFEDASGADDAFDDGVFLFRAGFGVLL